MMRRLLRHVALVAVLLFDAVVLVPPVQVLAARVHGGWPTLTMVQAIRRHPAARGDLPE